MRQLPPPTAAAADVFLLCISKVRDEGLKRRLRAVRGKVEASEKAYREAGAAPALYLTQEERSVGDVTSAEMVAVYDSRMVGKAGPGRPFYNTILASAHRGICPLCGQRAVTTLDHYLPKSRFPSLAVTPLNLIPACDRCNKDKLDSVADRAEEQTLHPYFDDIYSDEWLTASVIESTPLEVSFSVAAPAKWSTLMGSRVKFHFRSLKLGVLYATHAAEEAAGIEHRIRELHQLSGTSGVRAHLGEQYRSRHKVRVNSWQTAFYKALAESDWYYRTGFNV